MDIEQLTLEASEAATVAALGLDATALDLAAPEAMAEILRRAAAVRCPCRRQTLVRAVMHTLKGTAHEATDYEDRLDEVLDTLIAYGDLLEVSGEAAGDADQIHLAPLGFVKRASGLILLLGGVPDHGCPLPDVWLSRIERTGHVRRLPTDPSRITALALEDAGFAEMSLATWERAPSVKNPQALVREYVDKLDASGPSGSVADLLILDADRSPRFYKGRWSELRGHTGTFVAKRKGVYGNTQWCFVRAIEGDVHHFLTFPTHATHGRACDEAWRLQAAIDATNGHPQVFRIDRAQDNVVLQLFSPVPKWVQRRWDAIGERLADRPSCLFSYRFPASELPEEQRFLTERLWMQDETPREGVL